MASLTPAFGGMTFERLNEKGLCWPCPTPDHPGTQYLHKDRFARGLGAFQSIDYRPPAEAPDAEYPLWLTTGTLFTQYLTGTMTRRCPSLHHENPVVEMEIHPEDAHRLHIQPGEQVKASSRRGTIMVKALGNRAGQARGGVHPAALRRKRRQPPDQRGLGPRYQDPGIQGVRGLFKQGWRGEDRLNHNFTPTPLSLLWVGVNHNSAHGYSR